jgi:hypothetical protein
MRTNRTTFLAHGADITGSIGSIVPAQGICTGSRAGSHWFALVRVRHPRTGGGELLVPCQRVFRSAFNCNPACHRLPSATRPAGREPPREPVRTTLRTTRNPLRRNNRTNRTSDQGPSSSPP